jgi:hypothetical protein
MYTYVSFQLRLSTFMFLMFLVPCISYAQELQPSDSLTAVLSAKENEMFTVITSGNQAGAEKLIADDYITINADGVMEGKENTVKSIGKFKGSVARLSDRKTRLYDNIAIINGKAKFYVKQILVAEIFYTEIWHYRAGQWVFIGWQGTMTGVPSYYPVIVTGILLILLYLVIRLVARKRRKHTR